jgi:hypothetical protein
MKTIYKYHLNITDTQIVEVPGKINPLTVQFQNGELTVWAEVDPDAPTRGLKFFVRGTGHKLPEEKCKYIGTVQEMGGHLIWHVYHATVFEEIAPL